MLFRGLRSRMPFPRKFPVPSIQEHPRPGPDSVLASSRLVWGWETFWNSRMLPKWKISDFNFGACQDFPDWYRLVNQIQHSSVIGCNCTGILASWWSKSPGPHPFCFKNVLACQESLVSLKMCLFSNYQTHCDIYLKLEIIHAKFMSKMKIIKIIRPIWAIVNFLSTQK